MSSGAKQSISLTSSKAQTFLAIPSFDFFDELTIAMRGGALDVVLIVNRSATDYYSLRC